MAAAARCRPRPRTPHPPPQGGGGAGAPVPLRPRRTHACQPPLGSHLPLCAGWRRCWGASACPPTSSPWPPAPRTCWRWSCCSARRGSWCAPVLRLLRRPGPIVSRGWLGGARGAAQDAPCCPAGRMQSPQLAGERPSHHPPPPAPQVLSESHSHKGQRAPSPPLRVVPLFETLADLEASRGVMEVRAAAPRVLLRLPGGCCCCCCCCVRACRVWSLTSARPPAHAKSALPDERQCLSPPCHHAAPAAACPVSRRRSSPTSGTAATWRRCTTTARRSCWAIPTRVGALVRGHAEVMLRSCWATPSRASVQHTLKRYGTCWAVLVARPWLPPSACLQPARRHA